jgi:hypothetical protein
MNNVVLPDSQKSYGGQYNLVPQQVPDLLFFALQVTLLIGHDGASVISRKKI